MTYDVLVYGPLFCDLIFTDLPGMPELGTEIFSKNLTIAIGGSAIVAAGLHRLGAKVGLIADIGNDPMSKIVGHLLDDIGIDRTFIREHDYDLPQITVALSFPEDRAFVTRFEKPKTPVDLPALLAQHPARHIHFSSFLAAFDEPDGCRIAHEAGLTVSMDPGWDEVALRDPRLMQMVHEVDVFLPSRSELCFMLNEDDIETALHQTVKQMRDGIVIMKNSAHGVVAKGASFDAQVPALPVQPIDTTGAGDAFDAGFLYAYTKDYALTECMRYGAVCGALTTTAVGGATGTPTLKEVEQWLPKLQS